jgi:NNP family nitrate/nitrite transporter-like MFS transporter
MDDLADARAGFGEQAVIFTRKHNWLMCWLYLGTFGSFIGFSAGLPMLMQSQYLRDDLVQLAWLGPLIGALLRPLGGWLADQYGGGRITFWSFVAMALGVAAVLRCLPQDGQAGNWPGFLAAFGLLFAASGIGNGSTFRMIPAIFLSECKRAAEPMPSAQAQAARQGNVEAAAVLGLASAVGAYGGFFIPKSYGTAIALTGSPAAALQVFILFYVTCIALTWWYYSRRHAPMPC